MASAALIQALKTTHEVKKNTEITKAEGQVTRDLLSAMETRATILATGIDKAVEPEADQT
jgi:hypothetical protein